MYELNHLEPQRFLELLSAREAAFAAAPAVFPPRHYGVNTLADALHPKAQALVVGEVFHLGDHCRAYSLLPDPTHGTEALACFRAGQYLSIRFTTDSLVTTRPLTICSSPADRSRYLVTVSGTDEVARYIHSHWTVGTAAEASAPLGDFYYERLRDAAHVLAVAEGGGILPFCAMAQAIADGSEACSMTLCALGDAPDLQAVEALAERCPNLTVVRLNDLSQVPVPEAAYTLFLSVSHSMRERITEWLSSLTHAPKNVRQAPSPVPADTASAIPVTLTVRHHGGETVIHGHSNETVLTLLERSRIPAPAHCRSGHCGWCRAKLLSGEVFLPSEHDNRRLADPEHNIIHPCCTYPRSDLTIEIAV